MAHTVADDEIVDQICVIFINMVSLASESGSLYML